MMPKRAPLKPCHTCKTKPKGGLPFPTMVLPVPHAAAAATTPSVQGDNEESEEVTKVSVCAPCKQRWESKEYCNICAALWKPNEKAMMCCDACGLWVHSACEQLSEVSGSFQQFEPCRHHQLESLRQR